MTTYGDFFSGGGGMTIGAKQAGYDVLFGVEYDEQIADIYRRNLGDHIIVEDVTRLNMATLPRVDVFHASPPCTNASVANANGGESPFDMIMAHAVCRYIVEKLPDVVTLENVYGYRNFESWHGIARTLLANGYTYKFWHINMADYGVPQTRKRMIVVARRDGIQPSIPDATHAKDPQPSFFGTLPRWVSWHEAIEDILHTLPDSQFAKWQLERLPDELRESLVVNPNDQNFGNPISEKNNPLFTVRIAGGSFFPRALLIEPSNASVGSDRAQNEPAQAVTTPTGGRSYRAFIVDGGNANSFAPRQQDEPARTIGDTERVGNIQRAAINGRVVKMTPRAIARFQSFPDWYELPERASLAVKVLGNAVPPLFAEKLYKHIGGTP